MDTNSWKGTLIVAALLCGVCSVVVSFTAVNLRSRQEENKVLDVKKNLLLSAGLLKNSKASKEEILEIFKNIETKLVDLKTGKFVKGIEPESFNVRQAAKDPKRNVEIPSKLDLGKNKVRAKMNKVYLVKEGADIKSIVLPVYGKGLWSTLYGFLALDKDTKTVKGFGFYEHGETPGLGGEVDNPSWKSKWIGKTVLDKNFKPFVQVKKNVNPNSEEGKRTVDGLSGATITSRGVQELLRYWLGDHGYGPFLANFRKGGN